MLLTTTRTCLRAVLLTGLLLSATSAALGAQSGAQPDAQAAGEIEALRGAAERGDMRAQVVLGKAYLLGEKTEVDDDKGVFWLRQAARGGDPVAQAWLGWAYEQGRGVRMDAQRAYSWYARSARQGYDWALQQRDRLRNSEAAMAGVRGLRGQQPERSEQPLVTRRPAQPKVPITSPAPAEPESAPAPAQFAPSGERADPAQSIQASGAAPLPQALQSARPSIQGGLVGALPSAAEPVQASAGNAGSDSYSMTSTTLKSAAAPADAEPTDIADQLRAWVDDRVSSQIPEQLQAGEATIVTMQLPTPPQLQQWQAAGIGIRVQADLQVDGSVVEPLSKPEQALRPHQGANWRWQITPVDSGKPLFDLALRARVLVPDHEALRVDLMRMGPRVSVELSWEQRAWQVLRDNQLAIGLTVLVPLFLWLGMSFAGRQRRG